MGVVTQGKKRRLEEEECPADRISNLPDGVLGDIVSLLPTIDGARTQVLSSRWRHLWRSAPLNLEVYDSPTFYRVPVPSEVSSILSSHPGPSRRFSISRYDSHSYNSSVSTKILGGWLQSPALDKLQELQLDYVIQVPESALRFSSTLRVATFRRCIFPDGNNASELQLPLLKQLSRVDTEISERYLHSLLAACPVLQSLLLSCNCYWTFPRVHIVSPNLISIGLHSGDSRYYEYKLEQLVIKDAPCLEKFLFLGGTTIDVVVISAPRLQILGECSDDFPRFQSAGTTTVQGSNIASKTAVVSSVKVIALSNAELCQVINLMECFPHLDKLYIHQITHPAVENWFRYQKTISTLDIRLRKVVLANYRGHQAQVMLAKFIISNARVLELMRFELLGCANVCNKWIERQRSLLEINKRASMDAQFDFVSGRNVFIWSRSLYAEVHDLSILVPFRRICQ